MKRFTGLDTRFFVMKSNLLQLQKEHILLTTGLTCTTDENKAKSKVVYDLIKTLKRRIGAKY